MPLCRVLNTADSAHRGQKYPAASVWSVPQRVTVLQGAKRPYVAFFGAAGVGGRPHAHAWLSRSTQGLRARLAAPPHCLHFSMPLAGEASADAADSRVEAQLAELGQVRAQGPATGLGLQESGGLHETCQLSTVSREHSSCFF